MSEKFTRPKLTLDETRKFYDDLAEFNKWARLTNIDTSKFDASELVDMYVKGAPEDEIRGRAEELAIEQRGYTVKDRRHSANQKEQEPIEVDDAGFAVSHETEADQEDEIVGVPYRIEKSEKTPIYTKEDFDKVNNLPEPIETDEEPTYSETDIKAVENTPEPIGDDGDRVIEEFEAQARRRAAEMQNPTNEKEKKDRRRLLLTLGGAALTALIAAGAWLGISKSNNENNPAAKMGEGKDKDTTVSAEQLSRELDSSIFDEAASAEQKSREKDSSIFDEHKVSQGKEKVTEKDLQIDGDIESRSEKEKGYYDLDNVIEHWKMKNKESGFSWGPAMPTEVESFLKDLLHRNGHDNHFTAGVYACMGPEMMTTKEAEKCLEELKTDAEAWKRAGESVEAMVTHKDTKIAMRNIDGEKILSSYMGKDGELLTRYIERTSGTAAHITNKTLGVDFLMRTDCGGQVIQIIDGKTEIVKIPGRELPAVDTTPVDTPSATMDVKSVKTEKVEPTDIPYIPVTKETKPKDVSKNPVEPKDTKEEKPEKPDKPVETPTQEPEKPKDEKPPVETEKPEDEKPPVETEKPVEPEPENPNPKTELEIKDPNKGINKNPDLNKDAVQENKVDVNTNIGNQPDQKAEIKPDNGQATPPKPQNIPNNPPAQTRPQAPAAPAETAPSKPVTNHEGGAEVTTPGGEVVDTGGQTHEDLSQEVGPAEPGLNPETTPEDTTPPANDGRVN